MRADLLYEESVVSSEDADDLADEVTVPRDVTAKMHGEFFNMFGISSKTPLATEATTSWYCRAAKRLSTDAWRKHAKQLDIKGKHLTREDIVKRAFLVYLKVKEDEEEDAPEEKGEEVASGTRNPTTRVVAPKGRAKSGAAPAKDARRGGGRAKAA